MQELQTQNLALERQRESKDIILTDDELAEEVRKCGIELDIPRFKSRSLLGSQVAQHLTGFVAVNTVLCHQTLDVMLRQLKEDFMASESPEQRSARARPLMDVVDRQIKVGELELKVSALIAPKAPQLPNMPAPQIHSDVTYIQANMQVANRGEVPKPV